jgi:hypothetical protein
MSLEQSTEVATGARRRIVALPARVEAPVALIMRESDQREALTERIGRRRVVAFPSLAHFCTEEQRKQPWVGIVVGYPCAWDAQLDRYVAHRSCITLYQVPEDEYSWPEAVQRYSNLEQVDAWLLDLLQPMPAWKKALEEARKKPRAPKVRTPRSQLSLPIGDTESTSSGSARPEPRLSSSRPEARASGATVRASSARTRAASTSTGLLGAFSHNAENLRQTEGSGPRTVTRRIVKSAPPTAGSRATKKVESRAATAGSRAARPESPASTSKLRGKAAQALPVASKSITLSARDLQAVSRAGAHLPAELVRLVGEIGLTRASQLLRSLEANARVVRSGASSRRS